MLRKTAPGSVARAERGIHPNPASSRLRAKRARPVRSKNDQKTGRCIRPRPEGTTGRCSKADQQQCDGALKYNGVDRSIARFVPSAERKLRSLENADANDDADNHRHAVNDRETWPGCGRLYRLHLIVADQNGRSVFFFDGSGAFLSGLPEIRPMITSPPTKRTTIAMRKTLIDVVWSIIIPFGRLRIGRSSRLPRTGSSRAKLRSSFHLAAPAHRRKRACR